MKTKLAVKYAINQPTEVSTFTHAENDLGIKPNSLELILS